MMRFVRIGIAALIFAGVCAACTPATNGGSGLLPSTHQVTPQDGGGGLPPGPSPKAIATRNP
jgi:hypothetical protein